MPQPSKLSLHILFQNPRNEIRKMSHDHLDKHKSIDRLTDVERSESRCVISPHLEQRAHCRRYGGKSERSSGCAICLCKECSARPIHAQISRRCCIGPGQVGMSCSLLVNHSPLLTLMLTLVIRQLMCDAYPTADVRHMA
jgi:hypothetical protein